MKLEVSTTEQNTETQDGAIRADMDTETVILNEPPEEHTDTERESKGCHNELEKQSDRVPDEMGANKQLDHGYMKVKKKKKIKLVCQGCTSSQKGMNTYSRELNRLSLVQCLKS